MITIPQEELNDLIEKAKIKSRLYENDQSFCITFDLFRGKFTFPKIIISPCWRRNKIIQFGFGIFRLNILFKTKVNSR